MKIIFTILALSCITIGFLKAQTTLVKQDFSLSNNIADYIGDGEGQIRWVFDAASYTGPFPGLAAKEIANQKLQIDLRSSNQNVLPSTARFIYGVGSSKLIKIQFKLNYERSTDGVTPKPAILWINNTSVLMFGRDNAAEYFVYSSGGYWYDGGRDAIWYKGEGGSKYSGEHVVTAIINCTSRPLLYNSETFLSHTFSIYVDGIFQSNQNWFSRNYDPTLQFIIETPRVYSGQTPDYIPIERSPLPTHRFTLDDILIEDLTSVLPVKLVDFTVSTEKGSALLQWQTAEEVNSDRFEIEHSMNAKDWKTLDLVQSAGDTKKVTKYQYHHNNPTAGINYYRLKMIDRDETFAYSSIKNVSITTEDKLIVFPNPVSDRLYLEMNPANKVVKVQITNAQGKQLMEVRDNFSKGIDLANLLPGIYSVSILQEDNITTIKKVLVQK